MSTAAIQWKALMGSAFPFGRRRTDECHESSAKREEADGDSDVEDVLHVRVPMRARMHETAADASPHGYQEVAKSTYSTCAFPSLVGHSSSRESERSSVLDKNHTHKTYALMPSAMRIESSVFTTLTFPRGITRGTVGAQRINVPTKRLRSVSKRS